MERVKHDIHSIQYDPSYCEDIYMYTFIHLSFFSYGRCRVYAFEGSSCSLKNEIVEILRDDHPSRNQFVSQNLSIFLR